MNPEERAMTNEERRALQLSELDILRVFKRLCEEHGLRYFLTAGTLIGAVRHKGFIPWDDDVDVAMPREDYDKLAGICAKYLPEGYYYQDSEVEESFPYFFAKIRKENTEVNEPCLAGLELRNGHYIDIFPLDACPASPLVAKLYFKLVWLITWAYQSKFDPGYQCGYTKPGAKLAYALLRRLPAKKLRALRDRIGARLFAGKEPRVLCTVGGAHGYPAETYDPAWFASAVDVLFEGETFPGPVGWHESLTHMYGDYMKVPDEAEREGHFTVKG